MIDIGNITSATEAIRARVWARWKRGHLARMSTDHGVPIAKLEAFAQGAGNLPEAAMHALTKEFYHNAKFDPIADKLIDTSPEATPIMRVIPEPYVAGSSPHTVVHDPNRSLRQRSEKPEPPPKSFKRPGFA